MHILKSCMLLPVTDTRKLKLHVTGTGLCVFFCLFGWFCFVFFLATIESKILFFIIF